MVRHHGSLDLQRSSVAIAPHSETKSFIGHPRIRRRLRDLSSLALVSKEPFSAVTSAEFVFKAEHLVAPLDNIQNALDIDTFLQDSAGL